MHIDSELRRTHTVPLNPATGEVWRERLEELVHWSVMRRDSDYREEAEQQIKALSEGVAFREQPYVCEYHYAIGSGAAKNMPELPKHVLGCHPDTWAALPQDIRDGFDALDVDKWRAELSAET